MTKLDSLIAELCPDGVEYKSLGEACAFKRGTSITKKDTVAGNIPVIAGGQTPAYYHNKSNRTGETVTVSGSGAYAGFVSYWSMPIFVSDAFSVEPNNNLLVKYVYYFLSNIQKFIYETKKGGGVPHVHGSSIAHFKIPLPPLPVQNEIVRILDNFTELTAELTAELTGRTKQYNYYRNELLTFGDDVPMVTLGEVSTDMYRGSGIKREEVTETGTPCVRYGEIYTKYNIWFDNCVSHTKIGTKTFEHGDVLFAITGESVEEIAKSCVYMGHEKCYAGGDIVVMKHKQNPKYIAYALSTADAQTQKSKGRVKSKVVHSSIPALKKIIIPIPPLEEQERIVSILDRFDTLTTDISSGLPAEIAARQKQYEYYRDKLLSFKDVK